jgi:adenylate cyclase
MASGVPLLAIALVGDGTVALLAAGGLVVGLLTLLLVASAIGRPLSNLRVALDRLHDGDTDVAVPVDDGSEVGLVQAGFNRTVAGLRERERLQDLFGRHVGTEVARRALEEGVQLGGELRNVTVLFVDIIDSTRLPDRHSPHEVVAMLNDFFSVVVDTVDTHGGWVNKFEGDAALCVFGAPTTLPDAAGAALASGRRVAQCLQLPAGIGIASGDAVVGNVGAAQRYEYTVIGRPVNEAARLTERAKTHREPRILASGTTVARAHETEAVRWHLGPPITLRGMSSPTRIATLQDGGMQGSP